MPAFRARYTSAYGGTRIYRIGKSAKLSGISERAIRFYYETAVFLPLD
jgi:DNA-binding transcriptional MerR regulator